MIGRNDVTGPRDVKITHFPRSPWRCAVAYATECRVRGPFPVSWHFPDCSPAFPCLTVSFFLSFEIERFQFPFFVALLFLFVLVHGHFCSVVVGFSISQPPFPSCQYVIPSEKYTSMTSVDCRVISSLHVQFNEMKVRLGHSYMSEYKRSTVASLLSRWLRCWRQASQQLTDPATLADAKLESTLMHEWKQQEARLPHCRFEKSRQASPPLWTDKAKSPCVCRFASTSNDHSISDGETELETFLGDTHIANRRDQAAEY